MLPLATSTAEPLAERGSDAKHLTLLCKVEPFGFVFVAHWESAQAAASFAGSPFAERTLRSSSKRRLGTLRAPRLGAFAPRPYSLSGGESEALVALRAAFPSCPKDCGHCSLLIDLAISFFNSGITSASYSGSGSST